MLQLHGIVPPVATPLDEDGKIDHASLHQLSEYLLDNGVHGLFALGSTGEAAAFDTEERTEVVRTVVDAARGRVPVLVGITDTSFNRIVAYAELARALGADGVVLSPTFYYMSNQPDIIALFRAVHAATSLPIIAYNIPSMVKVPFEGDTLVKLAQEGVICALKDSSPDISATRENWLRLREIEGISVLTGLEAVVDLALTMGLHGAVPGLGNVAPRAYTQIYELVKAGRLQEAQVIQEKLIRLFNIIRQGRSGQSFSDAALGGFKAALKHLGVIKTSRMHTPWQGLGPEEESAVQDVLSSSGIF
jgi:4-hydroxy-tetrahydrodipicolinate synthase